MFTQEQKNLIKQQNFPDIELQKVTLSDSGQNENVINISFILSEIYNSNNKKILNNPNKDKIKIKVLLLNDQQQVDTIKTTPNINSTIENFSIINKELSYYEFVGNLPSTSGLIDFSSRINVPYSTKIFFNKSVDISNLSVGIIVFQDVQEYAKELKIPVNNIDESLLFSTPSITELVKNNKNISNGIFVNLTKVKQMLNTSKTLDKLFNNILSNDKITKHKNNVEKNILFTKPFFSRDDYGRLHMIFAFDYAKMLKNIISHDINAEQYSRIVSFKILKREYYNDLILKTRKFLKKDSLKVVVSSLDKDDGTLNSNMTESGVIEEVKMFDNLRTITVTDNLAYNSKLALVQYGVQVTINNTIYSKIKDKIDLLNANNKYIQKYLLDAQRVEYYDFTLNKFKDEYVNSLAPTNEYQNINKIIDDLLEVCKILNIPSEDEDFSEIKDILRPEYTNQLTISYFQKIYKNMIALIDKKFEKINSKDVTIDHWFSDKNLINTIERPSVGYYYLNRGEEEQKFLTKSIRSLSDEIKKTTLDNYKLQPSEDTFFIPIQHINISDQKIILSSPDFIKNAINIEIDIKNYNTNTVGKDVYSVDYIKTKRGTVPTKTQKLPPPPVNLEDYKKPPLNYSKWQMGRNYSVQNSITNIANNKTNNLKNFKQVFTQVQNEKINSTELLLGILRSQFDITSATTEFSKVPYIISSFLNGNPFISYKPNIKIQEIKNDLEISSAYLLLYNTICTISYLDSTANLKQINDSVRWKRLTNAPKNPVLCKLSIYQNRQQGITDFNQIKLPLYDQYFILTP